MIIYQLANSAFMHKTNDGYRSSLLDEYKDHELTFLEEYDSPAETSMYFGFLPIQTPCITRTDRTTAKHLNTYERSTFPCAPEEKASILRLYTKNELYRLSHPVLFYYNRARNLPGVSNDASHRHIGLDIIGASRSVADALAIKTAYTILKEEGYKDIIVEINSIGDTASLQRFESALVQFYRDRINEIPPKYHPIIKNNVFDMLQYNTDEVCKQINCEAPQAISFLSDESRHYFMSVLEHLEELKIPYRISNTVVGNKHISSQVVFTIKEETDEDPTEQKPSIAMGTRYNRLARKVRLNRDIYAVGVTLSYVPLRSSKRSRKTPLAPRYFFAHLGDTARRKSLALIDTLRQSKICVHHSLIHDSIREQLKRAEHLGMPYILIMGQKEATENAVVVRNMSTMSQETVHTDHLIEYLKRYTR